MVRVNFPLPKACVMSDPTPLLSMPLIQAAQAQKHVSHNAAIEQLDMIVQLTIEATDVTTPPSGAAEGQAWAIGANATGAWAGRTGDIAAWRGGGWLFATPQIGWRAWDKTTATALAFDGTGWVIAAGAPDVQNLDGLGVNATSDATNKLTVSSDATLLTHDGTGHQLKINKANASDTASLLYQTNWSGRAEMGLNGTDDFSVKVSADGSSFTEAMRINGSTGEVAMPATGTPQLLALNYRYYLYSDRRWVGPTTNPGSLNASSSYGTASQPIVTWDSKGTFVPAGTAIRQFTLTGTANHSEITTLNLRLFFQYGPWNTSWSDENSTTRDLLHSANINLDASTGMSRAVYPITYTTPADGYFIVAARPGAESIPTTTRYFYAAGALGVTVPPSA